MDVGRIGIWSGELRRRAEDAEGADAAAELDDLGYSALWIPGGSPDTAFDAASNLLRATRRAAVATGILSVWDLDPERVAAERAQLNDAYEGRFVLGLGVSHAARVDRDSPGRYRRPVATMRAYLESLDAAAPPVPIEDRVIAALGPRMLDLAGEMAAGAHPYLVTPEHTRAARERLGPERMLAPEQGVVLETDADRARSLARGHLETYLRLPNYANNLRRLGFGDADLDGGGSDRLVDAVIAWGDEAAIRARVDEHRAAGADHVCIQAIAPDRSALPREAWRRLAPALAD